MPRGVQAKRPAKRKTGWQRPFLRALADTGLVHRALKRAKISHTSVQHYYKTDADFRTAYDEALQIAADALEAEAVRRARDGVKRIIWWQGTRIGQEQEYSDGLLMFLLKGVRPEKFSDRVNVNMPAIDSAIEQLMGVLSGGDARARRIETAAAALIAVLDGQRIEPAHVPMLDELRAALQSGAAAATIELPPPDAALQ